jgi:hypothetical protein
MTDEEFYSQKKENFLKEYFNEEIAAYKPFISDIQIKNGSINRYFVHFISTPQTIIEINKEVYDAVHGNPFYTSVKITWYIRGMKETRTTAKAVHTGVIDNNKKNVEDALLTMRGLSYYITDFTQFWQGP